MKIAVVIPALNEAGSIAELVSEVKAKAIDWVFVVDNGSTDETSAVAEQAGAIVVSEPQRGYGAACIAGTTAALAAGAEVIVYIDGDGSAVPAEMPRLLEPILAGQADFVLGSRPLGGIEAGAMPAHQRLGNALFATLVGIFYGVRLTDTGPYRAIRADLVRQLDMQERTYGWPTEMTVKCAKRNARIVEVPITWRVRRAGVSKVGGTLRGSVLAAQRILGVTFRYVFR